MSDVADRTTLRAALLEGQRARLVRGEGMVTSARAFAARTDGLALHEIATIARSADAICDRVPDVVTTPWRLAVDGPADGAPRFAVDGARSVHLAEHGLQIKACRPVDDPSLAFIGEEVDPRTGQLVFSRLPFGVLTAEGVLREILAFAFAVQHKLPVLRRPVAVIDYGQGRYALVLESPPLRRLEAALSYPPLSLDDLLAAAVVGDRAEVPGIGEVQVAGVERAAFVEAKAEQLVRWHTAGGFRGILNSNIGNEVLLPEQKIALTDFDSFRELPLPSASPELEPFVLYALLEAVRSSLPIAALALEHQRAAAVYQRYSSSFAAYVRVFRSAMSACGWSLEAIDRAVSRATSTEAFEDITADQLVTWRHLVQSYAPGASLYVPHGARRS